MMRANRGEPLREGVVTPSRGFRFRGVRSPVAIPLCALAILLLHGCASHDQVQYFEVADPESGNVNYYRLSVHGQGGLGVDYHMQAGYFSAASVDVLRGQMPNMPEVDLPVEQQDAFERLTDAYYDALLRFAESLPAPTSQDGSSAEFDDAVLARARLVWFGQLSPGDVAAMGMNYTTNPFQFRKLVFWAASKNVDLRSFGSEIDAMLSNATALVRAQKAESDRRESRRQGLQDLLKTLAQQNTALAPYAEALSALLGADAPTRQEATP